MFESMINNPVAEDSSSIKVEVCHLLVIYLFNIFSFKVIKKMSLAGDLKL